MMTSGTNRAGGHAVQRVVLGAAQCQGQGTRRIALVVPWLACSLPGTLQGNKPPTPTLPLPILQTHCLGLMRKEELRAWEPTFLLEKPE